MVEVLISLAVGTGILALGYTLLSAGDRLGSRSARTALLQDSARTALDRMSEELREAGTVNQTARGITFRKVVGFSGGKNVWSAPISYEVSNGSLERIEGSRRTVIARSVRACRLNRQDRAWKVRLELQRSTESAVLESVILPRNR